MRQRTLWHVGLAARGACGLAALARRRPASVDYLVDAQPDRPWYWLALPWVAT